MSFNLDSIVRENVKGLKPYSSARDEYVSDGSKMVFLDANENPYENGVNRYPDPKQRELKAVLAEQKGIGAENILLGNGSDEVLDLLFRAFCEPKIDNVISLPPTYGMYKVLAGINAVANKEVLLTSEFQPNIKEILEAVDKQTKIIFVCSPNNPTGNSISEERIGTLLRSFTGLVVIDEAYIDFSPHESWSSKLAQFPNLIITQTLSKAYGMAGIRLGICLASEAIITVLNTIKPPYNVNELTQRKALSRINDSRVVQTEIQKIIGERDRIFERLNEIEFVKKCYSSDANFILAVVDDADRRYNQLLQKGIVVRNRSTQARCDNTLRFTIGTPEENNNVLKALRILEV